MGKLALAFSISVSGERDVVKTKTELANRARLVKALYAKRIEAGFLSSRLWTSFGKCH